MVVHVEMEADREFRSLVLGNRRGSGWSWPKPGRTVGSAGLASPMVEGIASCCRQQRALCMFCGGGVVECRPDHVLVFIGRRVGRRESADSGVVAKIRRRV